MSEPVTQYIGSHQHVVQRASFDADDPNEARHEYFECLDCGQTADNSYKLALHSCRAAA